MLKPVILQQKEERGALLQREYVERAMPGKSEDFLASDLIKLVTGPRRAGKSVFSLQLLRSKNFANT